jgi:TrmH family RNA methyltransferase
MAISKNEIKFVQALHQKKFRQIYKKFIVEGEKIARETLLQGLFQVHGLYALQSWLEENRDLYAHLPAESIHQVSAGELERISALQAPNNILLVVNMDNPTAEETFQITQKALFLDDIQDPGNLGAILRIADWFGITHVVSSPGTVEFFNPKVIQATMGAFLRVRVKTATLQVLCKANPGIRVMGATLYGENTFKTKLPDQAILVIGNESTGISEDTLKLIDKKLTIPKPEGGGAESLNAAVATGILVAVWVNGNRESIP